MVVLFEGISGTTPNNVSFTKVTIISNSFSARLISAQAAGGACLHGHRVLRQAVLVFTATARAESYFRLERGGAMDAPSRKIGAASLGLLLSVILIIMQVTSKPAPMLSGGIFEDNPG